MFRPDPAGLFLMGSEAGQDDERPVHQVEVDAFECAVHPVTQHQYAMFLTATGHTTPREWPDTISAADLPVTGVSWLDAQAYCHWRRAGGDPVRLPTEAEWERAARGGLPSAVYPWGETIPGWVPDGGRGPQPGPWPVTLGEPNGFGVFGIGATSTSGAPTGTRATITLTPRLTIHRVRQAASAVRRAAARGGTPSR
jgi:iron(II)-dependent oxidoreductase